MWTKNYKNMIKTLATCLNEAHNSSSAVSGYPISDTYFFNFKAPNGKVYEIRHYPDQNASYNEAYSVIPVIAKRDYSGALSASCIFLTDQTKVFSSSVPSKGRVYYSFGSDGTAPTELDYKLGAQITQVTIKNSSTAPTMNEDGTVTVAYTIIFTADADITIREVGLFFEAPRYAYSSSCEGNFALINRIVLDTPVSVANGDVAQIQFSVTSPTVTFA